MACCSIQYIISCKVSTKDFEKLDEQKFNERLSSSANVFGFIIHTEWIRRRWRSVFHSWSLERVSIFITIQIVLSTKLVFLQQRHKRWVPAQRNLPTKMGPPDLWPNKLRCSLFPGLVYGACFGLGVWMRWGRGGREDVKDLVGHQLYSAWWVTSCAGPTYIMSVDKKVGEGRDGKSSGQGSNREWRAQHMRLCSDLACVHTH